MKKDFQQWMCRIGMALLAVVVSMGLASCGNDDDDNGGGSLAKGKRLVSIAEIEHYTTETTFTYDADGKLVKATNGNTTDEFAWGENSINITEHYSRYEDDKTFVSLANNKISSYIAGSGEDGSCTYSGNKLVKVRHGEYTWENGNITKFKTGDDDTYTCTYYTDKVNKHPIVDIEALRLYYAIGGLEYGDEWLLVAHPSLIGTTNKNLLKSVVGNDGWTRSYEYELDKDGYPTKIVETYGYPNDNKTTYIITWE